MPPGDPAAARTNPGEVLVPPRPVCRVASRACVPRARAEGFSCGGGDLCEASGTAGPAPGEVWLFASLAVHRAPASRPSRVRSSVGARCQQACDPVGEVSVRADDGLSWEGVYRGRSAEAPRHGWRRPGARIVPLAREHHTRHAAP